MAALLLIAVILLAVSAGVVSYIVYRTFKRENQLRIKELQARRKRK